MCRACFQEHQWVVREVQGEPIPPAALMHKLWGQQFEKNRTPANRARIAYAAHYLATMGDDELLQEVERVFLGKVEETQDFSERDEKGGPLSEAAHEVTHLEAAIGARDQERQQKAGEYRTKDGHWVRSKSEREIANFLFDNRIPYQYERRVTIGNVDLYPDFFLPDVAPAGLYLEHFGRLDDARYHQLAERKAELFKKAGLLLVATTEEDAKDFDSALQRKLARFIPRLNHR
jgi:hypothetical protein